MAKKRATSTRAGRDAPADRLNAPAPIPMADVLGQARALATLDAAIASGRLHHAWIFHGPAGVGKFTTALALAAVALDPTTAPDLAGRLAPQPGSEVQAMLARGAHPDLHVVVKELARFAKDSQVRDRKLTNIPMGVIQEHVLGPVARRATVSPGGLASKVFIIDEAELIGYDSQNTLLKTLEEPPPGALIILVTDSEERLTPTIRSRCQRVAFTPLDDEAMHAWLERSGPDIDPAQRGWLLSHAAGSPGRLVRAIEGGLFAWHEAVGPMLDQLDAGRYPIALAPTMASLVDDWAKAWVKRGEKEGENRSKDSANRVAARQMLSLVADHYRARLREDGARAHAADAIDRVAAAESAIAGNVQVPFVMEQMVAGIAP